MNYFLPAQFLSFYLLQVAIITFMSITNKTIGLVMFYATTLLLVPWMLLFNMYGNLLNE